MPKMKSPTIKVFKKIYIEELKKKIEATHNGSEILRITDSVDDIRERHAQLKALNLSEEETRLQRTLEKFEQIISNNEFYAGAGPSGESSAAATPTASGTH
jgi:hypothetical protein